MKVLVACANGSGTSLMMSMTVKKAMQKVGLPVTKMHHCAVAEGKSSCTMYDIVFTSKPFVPQFKAAQEKGIPVIGMMNVMSEAEAIEKLKEVGLVK